MVSKFSKGIPSHMAIYVGTICLALSILTERYLPATKGMDFLAGMLLGLSITMNIWGIFRQRH